MATTKRKNKNRVRLKVKFSEYDTQAMFGELTDLLKLCMKTGNAQVALNVILARGRLCNVFDPFSNVQKLNIKQQLPNNQMIVQIEDFNTSPSAKKENIENKEPVTIDA